jgi:hypothetical protein
MPAYVVHNAYGIPNGNMLAKVSDQKIVFRQKNDRYIIFHHCIEDINIFLMGCPFSSLSGGASYPEYTQTLPPPAIFDMSDNFLPLMANFWTPTLPTLKLDIIYLSAQFLRSIG